MNHTRRYNRLSRFCFYEQLWQKPSPIWGVHQMSSTTCRDLQKDLVPVCRELGIGIVAYSPIGRGFLTGKITKMEDLDPLDFRLSTPRFAEAAFQKVWWQACAASLSNQALFQQHFQSTLRHQIAILLSCCLRCPLRFVWCCVHYNQHCYLAVLLSHICLVLCPSWAALLGLDVVLHTHRVNGMCGHLLIQWLFWQNLKLVENVKQLAAKKNVTAGQLALAWVQHQVCLHSAILFPYFAQDLNA